MPRRLTILLLATWTGAAHGGTVRKKMVDPRERPAIGGVYEASTVTGDVRVWRRFGANWSVVERGDQLVSGELVQLAAGATLAVRGISFGAGDKVPKGFILRAEEPLITRVEERSLRQLEAGGYFVPIDIGGDDKKKDEPPPSITAAWERMISLFDTGKSSDEARSELATMGGNGVTPVARDDVREIRIDHPRDGDTYFVESLPTEVAVTWSRMPPEVRSLRILFWKAERGTPLPVGQTDESYFRLPIMSPGRYYVRIESPDGQWRSENHLFIVLPIDQIASKGRRPKRSPAPSVSPSPSSSPSPSPTPKDPAEVPP